MTTEIQITRCLSLTQPWATLVAIGAKRYETRSWLTKYRGWIAIHASKGFPLDCVELCLEEPFASVLIAAGVEKAKDLPVGQVICVANLVDCISTHVWAPNRDMNEYRFGDYSKDRYAWKFQDVKRVDPFAAKGSLGLWNLPTPIVVQA